MQAIQMHSMVFIWLESSAIAMTIAYYYNFELISVHIVDVAHEYFYVNHTLSSHNINKTKKTPEYSIPLQNFV